MNRVEALAKDVITDTQNKLAGTATRLEGLT